MLGLNMFKFILKDTTAATTVYDALSHVADLEENVYVELQVAFLQFATYFDDRHDNDFSSLMLSMFAFKSIHQRVKELYESMEEPSFDIEAALPNLIDFSQFSKLRGLCKSHEIHSFSSVEREILFEKKCN